jgi:hypothetical protein
MAVYNDKEVLRSYVTGVDHLQYSWLADGMVQVRPHFGAHF